jgi:hypothetical protein
MFGFESTLPKDKPDLISKHFRRVGISRKCQKTSAWNSDNHMSFYLKISVPY